MADLTYCTAACSSKSCERHISHIRELEGQKYVSLADFAPTCRYYIAEVLQYIEKEASND